MTTLESKGISQRYHGLDGLRAAMMLLGLLLHAVICYIHLPADDIWTFRDESTHAIWTNVLFFIHVFRMPIFYVMAGFFAALLLERRGAAKMVRNRAGRILVPFLIGWVVLKPLTGLGFSFAVATRGATLAEAWRVAISTPLLDLYSDRTIHLWFLHYLLLFYVSGLALGALARCFPPSWRQFGMTVFAVLVSSRWRALWFCLPTAAMLTLNPAGLLKTSLSFVPDLVTFTGYGVFFGFGWLLYLKRELLPTFERHAWLHVVLALALAPINLFFTMRGLFAMPDPDRIDSLLTAVTGALIVWLLTFGLTGLFGRYLKKPNPVIRYVVDASYWVYLIHLPFCIWIPGLLAQLPWSSTMKILVLIVTATPLWWLSYDFLVRNSLIGVALNGRRYPRGLPTGMALDPTFGGLQHGSAGEVAASPVPSFASKTENPVERRN